MSHVPQQDKQLRRLEWEGCYNVRDLGGYPTQDGGQTRRKKLVRSDSLHTLTPEGQAALREYGVRTIIDVRLPHELERDPSPFAPPATPGHSGDGSGSGNTPTPSLPLPLPRYVNLPIHERELDPEVAPPVDPQTAYIIILEKSKAHIARIIKTVAASMDEGCVLVHCQGGKDRTGIIIALLLSLAGVSREVILEDYALSEAMLEHLYVQWAEEQKEQQEQQEQIKALGNTGTRPDKPKYLQARPETMNGVLDHLDTEYGGVDGYLQAAGVTQLEIEQIRYHLTVPPRQGK